MALPVSIEGVIDYNGQKVSLRAFQAITVLSAIVAFAIGFQQKSLILLWKVFGGGVGLALLISMPSWPFLNKTPVNWLSTRPVYTKVAQPSDKKTIEDSEDEDEEE